MSLPGLRIIPPPGEDSFGPISEDFSERVAPTARGGMREIRIQSREPFTNTRKFIAPPATSIGLDPGFLQRGSLNPEPVHNVEDLLKNEKEYKDPEEKTRNLSRVRIADKIYLKQVKELMGDSLEPRFTIGRSISIPVRSVKMNLGVDNLRAGQNVIIQTINLNGLDITDFVTTPFGMIPWEFWNAIRARGAEFVTQILKYVVVGQYGYIVWEILQGEHYTVMEYVEAVNPINSEAALHEFATRLLRAIANLKACGLYHGDLNPYNVNINVVDTRLGGKNHYPTIINLAACVNAREEIYRVSVGNPTTLPPEVVIGGDYWNGSAVTVWGIGTILYTLMEGRLPFTSTNPGRFKKPFETKRFKYYSEGLRRVVTNALSHLPNRPTFEELAKDPWFATKTHEIPKIPADLLHEGGRGAFTARRRKVAIIDPSEGGFEFQLEKRARRYAMNPKKVKPTMHFLSSAAYEH